MKSVMIQCNKQICVGLNELEMVAKMLLGVHAHDFLCVLLPQLIQPEINHILFQIEVTVESLSADGSFLSDFRDGDLLERPALH